MKFHRLRISAFFYLLGRRCRDGHRIGFCEAWFVSRESALIVIAASAVPS